MLFIYFLNHTPGTHWTQAQYMAVCQTHQNYPENTGPEWWNKIPLKWISNWFSLSHICSLKLSTDCVDSGKPLKSIISNCISFSCEFESLVTYRRVERSPPLRIISAVIVTMVEILRREWSDVDRHSMEVSIHISLEVRVDQLSTALNSEALIALFEFEFEFGLFH